MIGVVVVTHGDLAREFISATEHIMGSQAYFKAVCIKAEDDMEARRKDILGVIKNVENGQGVLVLTDMLGGTPANLAVSVMKKGQVEVVSGVNLPMLVKLAALRRGKGKTVRTLVEEVCRAGRKYINDASAVLEEE